MNEIMQIIRINAFIQRKLGTLTLDGKTILCIALDRTCAFATDEASEITLTDAQLADVYQQLYQQLPKPSILGSRRWTMKDGTVGVVAVETFADEWKAYIGVVRDDHPRSDEATIAYYGAGLTVDEAAAFFPQLEKAKYKREGEL